MSLISAAPEKNDLGTESIRDSVYQTSGKPLSKEALYRAKLKYGVFQSPAKGSGTGVVDSKTASDTAANLANNNKTTIEAYKRLLNPHASKAASAVSDSVVGNKSSPSTTAKPYNTYKYGVKENAAAAAATAAPISSRSRASSIGQTSITSSSTGVLPVNTKIPKMDISKVLAGAEKNAATHVNQRVNPETYNYVKGITDRNVGKAAGASFSITSEMVQKLHTKEEYAKSVEKQALASDMAQSAAEAMRDFNPNDITDKNWRQKEADRKQMIKYLSSDKVLAKAKESAQQKLSSIDRECANSLLYNNDSFNRAAYAKAQENLTLSRSATAKTQNKVNVGGGLWISENDIDNIAKEMVAPILDEVHQRTDAQRALDIDIEKRTKEYNQQYEAWVQLQISRQNNDAMLPVAQEERHKAELGSLEKTLTNKYQSLCTAKDEEVALWETKLKEKQEEMEKLKLSLENQLKDRDEKLIADREALEGSNALDLEDSKKEQEVILVPFRTDLETAKKRHIELNEERDKIRNEIAELTDSIANHKNRVIELQEEIDGNTAKISEENEALKQLSDENTNLKDDIEVNYITMAEKAKEEAKISSEEARIKQLNVDALINERQAELTNTELQLKREKLALIESLRNVAELKGDDKLDEEKVKAFVGTTSDQFLSQQKEAETKKVEPEIEEVKPSPKKEITASAPAHTTNPPASTSVPDSSSKLKKRKSIKRFFGLKGSDGTSEATNAKENVSPSKTDTSKPKSDVPKPKDAGDSLEPTFSGFSQGSAQKASNKQTEGEEEDEDVLKERPKNEKRKSLFREIF